MSDVFISYSSEDRPRARLLAGILQEQGLSVWWDRDIVPGQSYDEVIEKALHEAKCVVVLWTSNSVTSSWVKTESAEAAEHDALVPAFLEKVDLPLEFRRLHTADLVGWQGETDHPGLRNLINAVEQIIGRAAGSIPIPEEGHDTTPESDSAATTPPRPPAVREAVGGGSNRWLLIGGGVALVAVIAVVAAILLPDWWDDSPIHCSGGSARLSEEKAAEKLNELFADGCVEFAVGPEPENLDLGIRPEEPLPDIEGFELTVDPGNVNGVVAEIFTSTEKSGSGTDGWMVEVAEAFNSADVRLTDGQLARVAIREIASGTGYRFVWSDDQQPDAYSPSNHLWIEMARARRVTMTSISEQLVPNVAGLLVNSDKARVLEDKYNTSPLTASTIVEAVIAGDVDLLYTNPFISSTGLNFLVTVLYELSGEDESSMLSPEVQRRFLEFQENITTFTGTTLDARKAICDGRLQVEATIIEHQTFVQANDCFASGFDFIPFGIAHDNPLYAVGNVGREKLEVLELFAEFARGPDYGQLARDKGFDPEPYEPQIPIVGGQTLIGAQAIWKVNKDAGDPVTAVIVTDVSGSMSEGGRIRAVRDALNTGLFFINDGNYVGLVTFNHDVTQALQVRDFASDERHQGQFKGAVAEMRVDGGTAMYDAIAVGLNLLLKELVERPGSKVMLIVLTDGETTEGLLFEDLSEIIRGLRIPVHTIGFEANLEELKRIKELVEGSKTFNSDVGNVAFEIVRLLNEEV